MPSLGRRPAETASASAAIAAATITDQQLDVADPEPRERALRLRGKRLPALDPDHRAGEPGQHGGRVAGAAADLQHPLGAIQLQRLADRGDDPGLGDRLPGPDR